MAEAVGDVCFQPALMRPCLRKQAGFQCGEAFSALEHMLSPFQPLEQQHGVIPDRDAEFRLFDRVVNVRENFSVPVGLRGTIIGIKGGKTSFAFTL